MVGDNDEQSCQLADNQHNRIAKSFRKGFSRLDSADPFVFGVYRGSPQFRDAWLQQLETSA